MSCISSTISYPCWVDRTVSRRAVLAGTIAAPVVLATACSATTSSDGDPDTAIRNQAAATEQSLIALYQATIARYPALTAKLEPIKAQHAEHLAAMSAKSLSPETVVPPVAASQSAAVTALIKAERDAAESHANQCVQVTTEELAWTLSLVCASESQHAAALAGGDAK